MKAEKLRAAKRLWNEIRGGIARTATFQKLSVEGELLDNDTARLIALQCRKMTQGRVLEIEDPTGFAVACMGDRYQLKYPGEDAWVNP